MSNKIYVLNRGQFIKWQGATWQIMYSWSHNEGYGARTQCYQLRLINIAHTLLGKIAGRDEVLDRVYANGLIARVHSELEQFGFEVCNPRDVANDTLTGAIYDNKS